MTEFDEIFLEMNKKAAEHFAKIPIEVEKTRDWLKNYVTELKLKIQKSEELKKPIFPKTPSNKERKVRKATVSSSENEETTKTTSNITNESSDVENIGSCNKKPKRTASKLAEQKINAQAHIKLNTKLRRPRNEDSALNDISNSVSLLTLKNQVKEVNSSVIIKQEINNFDKEDMPPPSEKPKKIRKKVKKESESTVENTMRVTRSKRNVKNVELQKSSPSKKSPKRRQADSDVILQEVPVPTVEIDSDTEETTDEEAKMSQLKNMKSKPLNVTYVQKSPLNVTHTIQKSPLNVTRIIQKSPIKQIEKRTDEVMRNEKGIKNNCTVVLEKMNSTVILEKSNMPNTNNKILTIPDVLKTPDNFSPLKNKKVISQIPQSDSKICLKSMNKNMSTVLTRAQSAVKPTRTELQLRRKEEQKKRLEKEEEAKRKREALIQAKAEEQRKKREEKQMKAQKAREEMEREKEEKLRQVQLEREEEILRKKRWLAKKQEELEQKRKIEEKIKAFKLKEQEKQRLLAEKRRLLATKPPPLPTEADYDSDSSSESGKTVNYVKPGWARSSNLYKILGNQSLIPRAKFEELFKMEATTPDLREIFETIDERMLKRNSSAIWRTPPRYSTLPKF